MNRWAGTQLGIAFLGTALFVWAGLQGFGVGKSSERFALHTQIGLLATLLILLGLLWIAVYVLACGRRLAALPGLAPRDVTDIARSVRWVAPTAGVAAIATVTQFMVAGRVFGGAHGAALHGACAATTLLLLLVAMAVAARGLTRHQRLAERLEKAARVLDSTSS